MPLRIEDTCSQALAMMSVYHVKHLPVVDNDKLLAIVSEDDVTVSDLDVTIGELGLHKSFVSVLNSDHLFEVLGKLAHNNLTVVPVTDRKEVFMGTISQEDIVKFYANSFSFTEPGSIVVIETHKKGYTLSELSRIIELENAAILSSFLTRVEDSENILVTLKINKQDIQNILASLERYDYEVKAAFTEEEYFDDLKDRYDALMSYLNV